MPSASASLAQPLVDWTRALRPAIPLSRRQTRTMVAAVAALHLGGGWTLMQGPAVRLAVLDAAPMRVEWLAPSPPAAPQAPPARPRPSPPAAPQAPPARPRPSPLPLPSPLPRLQPQAVLAAPSPAALPAETVSAPPTRPLRPETPAAMTPEAQPVPPAPAAPRPPAPRRVDATAVSYALAPPVEVPRAARRAGESGVVWLRVVVDTRGLPALVQLQRSSGHARLDEQALWAMRQARFRPHTENGTPIEVEVIAPIEYLLE